MKVHNRVGIYAGLTSLVLMSAVAGSAFGQTKTFPPGTDCSALSGADMTACQNQMSSQQQDSTGGPTSGTSTAPLPNAGGAAGTNGVVGAPNGGTTNNQNGAAGTPNTSGGNSTNGTGGTSNP